MKVKNIMFSGFAAAILIGTAQAATTPFEIASKAYVDKQITDLSGTGGAVAAVDAKVDTLEDTIGTGFGTGEGETVADAIDGINDTIGEVDMGTTADTLTGAIAEIEGRVDTAEGDIDKLEAALGSGFGTGTGETTVEAALATKVDKSAVSTAIPATGGSNDKWASEKAVVDALASVTGSSGSVAQQIASALGNDFSGQNAYADVTAALADKQNASDSNVASADVTAANHLTAGNGVAGNLVALGNALGTVEGVVGNSSAGLVADVAALQQTIGDGTTSGVAADVAGLKDTVGNGQLANGFSDGVDTVIEALNDLQSTKADAADVYTKTELDSMIGAKLDHPATNTCTAASGHCVLSLDTNNNLTWVDITVPYTTTTSGNEEPNP